ncbi:MAG TPA: pyruvate kinase [Candidatus Nanopelagicales bacterium]|nr:pyruvate kinase [Candidatus Nanopelagicales bacterium]
MRRAKIVCTLGPATSTPEAIASLVDAGMDVARLNLSHGEYGEHERVYRLVRRAADDAGRGVGVLVDLQGPKIRLGSFSGGPVQLRAGEHFMITTEDRDGDSSGCSTTYDGLPGDVNAGDMILIDDGRVSLRVAGSHGATVDTVVVDGGQVSDHKGLNLPGVAVSVPAMSAKDIADLRWALQLGVDLIALSFVRSAADLLDVHQVMDEEGLRLPVLAKIEKPQAVQHLEEIVDAFDGIMVARGDLGVELPLEQVPLVQKRVINLARSAAKPVIVATQMLDSMETASRPTRAEVSDVANAVLDGADALMLSGETSIGTHPALVVSTMHRIISQIESEALDRLPPMIDENGSTSRALTRAAVDVGRDINAAAIVAFTETGRSARMISRHRCELPLLAFTPNPRVRSQLALTWGVETFLAPFAASTDQMVRQVDSQLFDIDRCKVGELIVVIAGVPPGVPGTTNGMRVHRMGSNTPSGI